MKIADLTVYSTNGKGGKHDRLRVLRDGEEIARVELRHRQPLTYVRRWRSGKYATSLRLQLIAAGVDESRIAMILDEPFDPILHPSKDPAVRRYPKEAWFSILSSQPTIEPP